MIFLSHQSKDKDFVAPIAHELKELHGEENVFYDEWSIKPGENILTGMSEGIENCRFFFYFITENSLESDMVNLEWTAALSRKSDQNIEFIPIRADNVNPPAIIAALKYLDLFKNGIETTVLQMQEIISGNAITKSAPTFNNIVAYAHQVDANQIDFYVTAKRFFEPGGVFVAISDLNEEEANLESNTPMMTGMGFIQNAVPEQSLNGFRVDAMQDLRKGLYLKLMFKIKRIPTTVGLLKVETQTYAKNIELSWISNISELPQL